MRIIMPRIKRYSLSDESILRGNWWSAGDSDRKFYGELICNGSKGALNIRGIYPTTDSPNFNGVVHGLTETEEKVTLFDCLCNQYGLGAAIIRYGSVLIGKHVPDRAQLEVNGVVLEPSSFLPWIAPDELESRLIGENAQIHLNKIDPITFLVGEDLIGQIHTKFYAFNTADDGYRVDRFGYIHFIFKKFQKIDEIESFVLRVKWLLSLLLGCAVESSTIRLKLWDSEAHWLPKQTKYSQETAMYYHRVPFGKISSQLDKIFYNWFDFYKKNSDSCNLFFANIYSGNHFFIENEFLNLAQAAEVFHSNNFEEKDGSKEQKKEILALIKESIKSADVNNPLIGKVMPMLGQIDRPGYFSRIKSLSEVLPEELKELFLKDASRFATDVKNLRNHLTHYSGNKNFSVYEKAKMVHLLKMIMTFNFLKKCGVEEVLIIETLSQRFSYLNYDQLAKIKY